MIGTFPLPAAAAVDREALLAYYSRVRGTSIEMCRPLTAEMYRVQPMEDVSPPWWNLGHTSWFFARNVLLPLGGERAPDDADFDYVLNSYYAALGPRIDRTRRGDITVPTTDDVYRYRRSVDQRMERLIETIPEDRWEQLSELVTIGLNHEQQHQELFYTEIKYILWQNPPRLRTAYRERDAASTRANGATISRRAPSSAEAWRYVAFDECLASIGHQESGFCWDNELPVHQCFLQGFALADRLVTNGDYLEFVNDGGYQKQLLWLDNGWQCAQRELWQAPLYWEPNTAPGQWQEWTLDGLRPLEPDRPVTHLSFYEADAFVRWRGETYAADRDAILPNEFQWEHAARSVAQSRQLASDSVNDEAFLDSGLLQPAAARDASARDNGSPLAQFSGLTGILWQWTSSYYQPYPGYRPLGGALAEYNSKFMDNQRVLRGGSCVTPRDHFHLAYRNFWPATTRFQFTGLRLARFLDS